MAVQMLSVCPVQRCSYGPQLKEPSSHQCYKQLPAKGKHTCEKPQTDFTEQLLKQAVDTFLNTNLEPCKCSSLYNSHELQSHLSFFPTCISAVGLQLKRCVCG
jgi:hypothetical protein